MGLLLVAADGRVAAAEACRAYHGDLERLGLRPFRTLEDDLRLTDPALQAGSSAR